MKLQNITKLERENNIINSKSMRELIISFGLSPNGSGGYRNIKNKILTLGLEIPKYNYYGEGYKQRKHHDEIVFCENSTYPRHKLKERIINEKLIKYSCFFCNNDGNDPSKKEKQLSTINDGD